ncbi:MAG: hypothetical protein ABI036_20850, partial [Fibrobacteria bacterium]
RMLEMMPSAELVDMYVSEEVDRIFEKVRKEYLTRQKSFGIDSTQVSAGTRPASGGTQAGMDKSTAHPNSAAGETSGPSGEYLAATREDKRSPYWRKNGFWIAGGLGLLAAGTAAYFVYSQQETSSGKTITIGQDTNK